MAAVKKKKGLMYKGKPLLRCGNRIYYGNLEDKLILALDIVESSKKQDVDVSTKVKVQICYGQHRRAWQRSGLS